jgi:beta-lactamase class A
MKKNHLLAQNISYTINDINSSGYAPDTKNHVAHGMTIGELCAAAITQSDNTAMNLLMKKLGGPVAVTAFAHSIGDNAFKLDRWEPELNSAIPRDLRDTTTPEAMAKSLKKLIFGNVLASPQREQLKAWLKNNTTGNNRIRAGVPKGWIVGDKTGTGDYGTTNDIGIIWPPSGSPIVVAAVLNLKRIYCAF